MERASPHSTSDPPQAGAAACGDTRCPRVALGGHAEGGLTLLLTEDGEDRTGDGAVLDRRE